MSRAEPLYDAIARQLGDVGEQNATLYLAKLSLALAHALDQPETALRLIRDCAADLERG